MQATRAAILLSTLESLIKAGKAEEATAVTRNLKTILEAGLE